MRDLMTSIHNALVSMRSAFDNRVQSRRSKVVASVVGASLAVCVSCACCTSIGNAFGGKGAQTADTAAVVATATARPTATPRATATPLPTVTPAQTPTPAPTITPLPTVDPAILNQQTAQHLAETNCNFTANKETATYDAGTGKVSVTAVVGTQWDVSSAQSTVKELVFECFKGFYTSPHANFVQEVYVEVDGPVTDAYGNTTNGIYGDADLTRATQQPFNWSNLYGTQAWDNYIYDSQWVRSN